MNLIRTIIWRWKYTRHIRSLLKLPWTLCWSLSGSGLENVNYDLSECPLEQAKEEYYAWADFCD